MAVGARRPVRVTDPQLLRGPHARRRRLARHLDRGVQLVPRRGHDARLLRRRRRRRARGGRGQVGALPELRRARVAAVRRLPHGRARARRLYAAARARLARDRLGRRGGRGAQPVRDRRALRARLLQHRRRRLRRAPARGARAACARATRCAALVAADRDGLARSTPTSRGPAAGARRRSPAEARRDGRARPQRRPALSEDELLAWWSCAPASARAHAARTRAARWRDDVAAAARDRLGGRPRGGAPPAILARHGRRRRPTRFTPSSTRCVALGAGALALELRVDTRARCGGADVVAGSCATPPSPPWGARALLHVHRQQGLQHAAAEWPALVGGSALFVGAANCGGRHAARHEARKGKGRTRTR